MPPTDPVVEATGLTKAFGSGRDAIYALDDVTVGFQLGSFTAIVGPPRSGKTTLLRCLAGLERPTAGAVRLLGVDVSRVGDTQVTDLPPGRVAFIAQPGAPAHGTSVATVLAAPPQVLFWDEPDGGGDLRELLRTRVTATGLTVVMATRDPALAALADLVLFLADGLLVDGLEAPTAAAVADRAERLAP